MYKKAILTILLVAIASWFWFSAKPWIENPLNLDSYQTWLWPMIALIIFVAFEGLALLIAGERPWRWGMVVVTLIPYFVVFGIKGFYWAVLPLMLLLQMYAGHGIRLEVEERIKIDIREIMDRGLSSLVTSILIMISVAFFLSPATQALASKQQLPPGTKTFVVETVKTFLSDQVKSLPPDQRGNALNQVSNEVISQFNSFLKPYFRYFPPVLAFGLFLVLQGLSFIIVWIAALVAWGLFALLKKSGFIRIRVVQKEAEELEF
jgi:hypothetical protein